MGKLFYIHQLCFPKSLCGLGAKIGFQSISTLLGISHFVGLMVYLLLHACFLLNKRVQRLDVNKVQISR